MIKVHQPPMILWKINHAKSWCFSILSTTHRNEKYSTFTQRPVHKDSQCYKSSRKYDNNLPTPYDTTENISCKITVFFNIFTHPLQDELSILDAAPSPER